jgi:hypothetical protein
LPYRHRGFDSRQAHRSGYLLSNGRTPSEPTLSLTDSAVPSKHKREGSIPSESTADGQRSHRPLRLGVERPWLCWSHPRCRVLLTAQEARFSTEQCGSDSRTRRNASAGGSGGLATNELCGGSTPSRSTTLSPADPAPRLRSAAKRFDSAREYGSDWFRRGLKVKTDRAGGRQDRRDQTWQNVHANDNGNIAQAAA